MECTKCKAEMEWENMFGLRCPKCNHWHTYNWQQYMDVLMVWVSLGCPAGRSEEQ